MPGTKHSKTPPSLAFDPDFDPQPFAEGLHWRQEGQSAEVQRVLRAGGSAWREFAPTASEFAIVAMGIENNRPTDPILQHEIGPQFWEAALGIGLPGREALPDLRFVYAFMHGALSDHR